MDALPVAMPMIEGNLLAATQAENARLIALLELHGIEWRLPSELVPAKSTAAESALSKSQKVALFRSLFSGRTDVFSQRWENNAKGESGYSPTCVNLWVAGLCNKKNIKCSDCSNRKLVRLSDSILYEHLIGKRTIGVYPLLPDDTCNFLAVDFDEADWKADALAFRQSCVELGVPAALEVSRSGNGAHIWIFFSCSVSARDARALGTAIISHTCARTRQLKLTSYDRLFPNQDTMPKGGFGNLIASIFQFRYEPEAKPVWPQSSYRLTGLKAAV